MKQSKSLHAITAFVIILLISVTVFFAVSVPRNMGESRAVGGVLDLTSKDLSKLFNLDGEWEFYYGELLAPDDFAEGKPDGAIISVPSSLKDAGYPLKNCATYRLTIETDEPELMMFIPQIPDASKLWINGKLLFSAGTVGKTPKEIVTSWRNDFVTFSPENGRAEVVVQAANQGFHFGGMRYSVTIGRTDVLLKDSILRRVFLGGVIGVFLIMTLYHVVLFIHNRGEWVYFVFALFCAVASVRFLLEINGFAQMFLKDGMGVGLIKLRFVIMIMYCIWCIMPYTQFLFLKPPGKFRRAFFAVCIFIPVIAVVVLPYGAIDYQIISVVLLTTVISFIDLLRSKFMLKDPYNLFFIFALGLFAVWLPITTYIVKDTLFMQAVFTSIFIVLSECFLLSVGYAETKRKTEESEKEAAALERLNILKTDLMRTISHETLTPLAVMMGYSEITARDARKSGQGLEFVDNLDTIAAEAKRIAEMIEEMRQMAVAREYSKDTHLVDIKKVITKIAGLYTKVLERKGTTLKLDIAGGLPLVLGNESEFTQVIFNLLRNADTHTENGTVIISAEALPERIRVTVSDTGCGIPQELLPRVFERGVHGDNEGSGFGLAICRDIIAAYGGEILIDSEQGKGTAVTFALPVYK